MRVRVTDELDCLSCFIMAWYVCWKGGACGQTAMQRRLLTKVEPQSISEHAALSPCHWPSEAADSLGFASSFSAPFSLHSKGMKDYAQLQTANS